MTHPLPPLPDLGPEWTDFWRTKVHAMMTDYARAALAAVPAPIYSKSIVKRLAVQMGLVSDDAPALAAPEPVAWMDDFGNAFPMAANKGAGSWMDEHKRNWKPLYAAPAPTVVPLTEEQIKAEFAKLYPQDIGILELAEHNPDYRLEAIGARHHFAAFKYGARAIERAHGITAAKGEAL